jgi:hypothetical protein
MSTGRSEVEFLKQGVEIGSDDSLEIRGRLFRSANEHVHRAFADFLARLDVRELLRDRSMVTSE